MYARSVEERTSAIGAFEPGSVCACGNSQARWGEARDNVFVPNSDPWPNRWSVLWNGQL